MFTTGGIPRRLTARPATPARRARGPGRRAAPRPAARRTRRPRTPIRSRCWASSTQMRRPSCFANSSARRTSSRSASFSSMVNGRGAGSFASAAVSASSPLRVKRNGWSGTGSGSRSRPRNSGSSPSPARYGPAGLALLGEADLAVQHRQVACRVVVDGGVDDALHAHREGVLHGMRHVDVEARRGEDRRPEAAGAEPDAGAMGARTPPGQPRQPPVDLVAHARLDRSLHAFTILPDRVPAADRPYGGRAAGGIRHSSSSRSHGQRGRSIPVDRAARHEHRERRDDGRERRDEQAEPADAEAQAEDGGGRERARRERVADRGHHDRGDPAPERARTRRSAACGRVGAGCAPA